MLRRRSVQIAIVAVLLLFGTLGTAGARQIWNESQAHSAWQSARAAASGELQHARAVGLQPAELAPLMATLHRLQSMSVPSSSPLLSSAQADYYAKQSHSYQALNRQIRQQITTVSTATAKQAANSAGRLNADISKGASLALDTTVAKHALSTGQATLRAAQTPLSNRQVSAQLTKAAGTLEGQIAAKQQRVNSILQQGGNTAAGVGQEADTTVQSAQSDLSLAGLFSKQAAADQTQVTKLAAAVHAQSDPQAAAVAEATLEDEVAAVHAAAAKTIPNKLVLVSTEDQMATMYENGQQVYSTPVTTGGPELPTDHGIFHIYAKISPFVFHSPWPPGSPYYYLPSPVTYWMPFDGAEGLHDAPWRSNFGPGSNLEPTDLGTGNYILGTHGCVNLPYDAAQFVWDWAPVGTTVVVV